RDSIDLFPLFERELLMFITFESEFQKIDGSVGNANAQEWWEYIKNGLNPRPKRMSDDPYKIFSKNVSQFNIELEKYLFNIIEAANKYLQQKFKQPYKLKIEFKKSTYDAFIPNTTIRDHKTIPPKIILKVDFIHAMLQELKGDLRRPHTFLNEARLSTIALSLRFAILDEKYIEVAPKILVLDDLLISLDMSNRDIVLELILNEFKKYQIIIMTHDRTFFNLTKRRLELENCIKDWVVKEIYQDETDTGIPIPFIPQDNNYYQQAKKYLKGFDYPACANYLRKETERILKTLLPINLTIYTKEDEGSKPLPLDQLIENFKAHYISFGGDFSVFKKLKEHKDLLLNPLSHDNIDTPIYKQELISVFSILDKLKKLEFKTLISIADNADTFMFIIETGNDGEKWSYKVKLKEHLRAFKKLDSTWSLNNPECGFIARKRISDKHIDTFERNVKLNQGYNNIRHALQIDANPPNDLWEIIKNSENKKLRDLI
ncbi:MAG TPA: hypothetical protein VNT20_21200, partial [Flavisolibacter sp.]|nr:hypothetical protein [Flavisolibacter sp.]